MKEVDHDRQFVGDGERGNCLTNCMEHNHPGREHEEWLSELKRDGLFEHSPGLYQKLPELVSTGPSETDKIIVTMLMRLYDVQMAILSLMNKPTADEIFDAHNQGGHFNPEIYVPEYETRPVE